MFTTYFAPSIGGIERLTELLATQFVQFGHDVALATLTPGPDRGPWSFPVVRQPSSSRFWSLLRWCDVHLQANLSLKHFYAAGAHRPFVVHHGTDYARASGRRGVRDCLKLACSRLVHGIACSHYIARRVGCRDVIGNPYDDSIFRRQAPLDQRKRDIVFLGRLVSEKGCDTLLEALAILRQRALTPSCTVVGDGPERPRLTAMTAALRLTGSIRFLGALHGPTIAAELNRHRIMVIPSQCHEAFGIAALEGLACGCLPIVSVDGGLVDAIGGHGLTFRNGDALDLADRLEVCAGRRRFTAPEARGRGPALGGLHGPPHRPAIPDTVRSDPRGDQMTVIVAHPTGNPNVRSDLRALERAGCLRAFYTTASVPLVGAQHRALPMKLRRELMRRIFAEVPPSKIVTSPLRELVRLAAGRLRLRALTRHEVGWASVDAVYHALDRRLARDLDARRSRGLHRIRLRGWRARDIQGSVPARYAPGLSPADRLLAPAS